jgi:hypothetical protein
MTVAMQDVRGSLQGGSSSSSESVCVSVGEGGGGGADVSKLYESDVTIKTHVQQCLVVVWSHW